MNLTNQTTVSNVQAQHIRPRYRDLKAWIADPKNLYIGRAVMAQVNGQRVPIDASIWGNPFRIGKDGTRSEVISKFEVYIVDKIRRENLDVNVLRNKNLGCWCVSSTCYGLQPGEQPVCHGQILARLCTQQNIL